MSRDEINEAFGVTNDHLDRTAKPYESGSWQGGVENIIHDQPQLGTITNQTRRTHIIRVHKFSDIFRNRTDEYRATEESPDSPVGSEEL